MRQKIIIFVIFHLIVFAVSPSKAQIVINEILASNTSTNLNEKNKQFVDWIEIYNDSDKAISIGGCYLTDDWETPKKWKVPYYFSIPPKGFKLFYADGTNTSNHTNFKLSIKGESIYLFDKSLVLIDSITYPQQLSDISYGRIAGNRNQLVYFQKVTPMKENPLSGMKELGFSSEPIFSRNAGFNKRPFKLELSVCSVSEKIYYTLDGSVPDQKSYEYLLPIDINKTSTIRARTYSESKFASKTITQTYLIKESFSLPVVSLVIDPKYLWDEKIGIYTEGENYRSEYLKSANYFQAWERPVNVEYFDVNGESGFNINAGLRIHGRSTRDNAQKSLAVISRGKYGSRSIPYKLFGEKSPEVIKSFLLRSGGNEWGETMFLDGLIHTLVNGKIDIDAQLYKPAIVFLNGEYWGIHNIREKINEHYIRSKHKDNSSELDIIETDVLEEIQIIACYGNMDEYNKMIEFIENNELSIKENYDIVKQWIDIDELINYLATQVYISNKDWPNNNMKFWKNRDEESKWRWILFDTDLSCMENNVVVKMYILEHLFAENTEIYPTLPYANILFRKLLENDEFKFEFIQRIAVYLNSVFESDHVLNVMDSLKRNIEPEIIRNLNKWGGIKQNTIPYHYTSKNKREWEIYIEYIRSFVKNRPSILRKNMMTFFNLKDTVNLKLRVNDRTGGRISLMGYSLKDGCFDGYIFGDVPIRMEAIPNKGFEFVRWKGGGDEINCVIHLNRSKKITAIFKKIE